MKRIESTSAARAATRPFAGFAVGDVVDVEPFTTTVGRGVSNGKIVVACKGDSEPGKYTITDVVDGGTSLSVTAVGAPPEPEPKPEPAPPAEATDADA